MQKIYKIILINVLLLSILYISNEYLVYKRSYAYTGIAFVKLITGNTIEHYPPERYIPCKNINEYKKRPVLLLGCSYTWGELLPLEKTLGGGIQKLTGRYTYNFGTSGKGAITTLALLKREEKRHLIPISHTPEYVIYTYMFHHPQRFSEWQFYNLLRKEKLIPFQKYNILYNSLTYQLKKNIEVDNYFSDDINVEKRMNLFFLTMQAIKKQSDKIFPDSKFILLIYSDVNNDLCDGLLNSVGNDTKQIEELFEIMNSNEFRKRIEKLGIQVISTEELIGRKMYKKEDRIPHIKGQEPFDPNHPHPSASAWNEILPALVNKMNL